MTFCRTMWCLPTAGMMASFMYVRPPPPPIHTSQQTPCAGQPAAAGGRPAESTHALHHHGLPGCLLFPPSPDQFCMKFHKCALPPKAAQWLADILYSVLEDASGAFWPSVAKAVPTAVQKPSTRTLVTLSLLGTHQNAITILWHVSAASALLFDIWQQS